MQINANITGIKYQVCLADDLKEIEESAFDVNTCPTACVIKDLNFAISRWVSPKRTRSYPYERVYNTLSNGKKITIIPVIKDEGSDGDRDFLQWDTISLMSLLDVYVILGFYNSARRSNRYTNKVSHQKFDNVYIKQKISEISHYHSSALHWNLQELKNNFSEIISKAKISYEEIGTVSGVRMHGEQGIDKFQRAISQSVEEFMLFSRHKSEDAQAREFVTLQPKEVLQTLTKAKITITNYLGGQYFLTVDEVSIQSGIIYLIEGKHSKSSLLPSKSDIKDGLLKMILYVNLKTASIGATSYDVTPVLLLSSSKLVGSIELHTPEVQKEEFYQLNKFNQKHRKLITTLFEEAKINGFSVILKNG